MSTLAEGKNDDRVISAKLSVPPFRTGACPKNMEELQEWLKSIGVDFTLNALFGYTAGRREDAPVDSRKIPRFMFDSIGRYLGLETWSPSLASWTRGGFIGETKTIIRTYNTVAEDMLKKGITGSGWHLAAGGPSGLPDLSAEVTGKDQDLIDPANAVVDTVKSKTVVPSQWFRGTAPDWDVYTIMYTGVK